MKSIILIISICILTGCNTDNSVSSDQLENRDGLFYLIESNELYTGKITNYHENGQVQVTAFLINGIADGVETQWWPNEVKRSVTPYVKGKKEGTRQKWNDSGILWFEAEFKNDMLNGTRTLWNDNGKLRNSHQYIKGKEVDGVVTTYDSLGRRTYDHTIINNQTTESRIYYDNGKVRQRSYYHLKRSYEIYYSPCGAEIPKEEFILIYEKTCDEIMRTTG